MSVELAMKYDIRKYPDMDIEWNIDFSKWDEKHLSDFLSEAKKHQWIYSDLIYMWNWWHRFVMYEITNDSKWESKIYKMDKDLVWQYQNDYKQKLWWYEGRQGKVK